MRCGCPRLSRRPRGSWGGRRPGRISAWWKWPPGIRAEARRSRPAGAWLRLRPAGWCSLWLTPPCSDRRFTLMHALADATLRTVHRATRAAALLGSTSRGTTPRCAVWAGPLTEQGEPGGGRREGRGGAVRAWWRAAAAAAAFRCCSETVQNPSEGISEDFFWCFFVLFCFVFFNEIFNENKSSATGRWSEMCHTSKASMTVVWMNTASTLL